MANSLDSHAKPPTKIRDVYKHYQKAQTTAQDDHNILLPLCQPSDVVVEPVSAPENVKLATELRHIFGKFVSIQDSSALNIDTEIPEECNVYQVRNMPGKDTPVLAPLPFVSEKQVGLLIYPKLFSLSAQLALLDKLFHRDIANSDHKTNIHLHYHVPYPDNNLSYFHPTAEDLVFQPKDPKIHKPFSIRQYLNKKLRWATLGGQYDWTNKVYPSGTPPAFPEDIKTLVEGIFPMKAEAAIVNLYSPGDTLSLHRDVSEECNRPLVSISLGCDAIFVCGLDAVATGDGDGHDGPRVIAMRLRSGDAVLMSGESRYAWHGVPKVILETCPEWMENWPAQLDDREEYADWRGWMKGKRINLNVRQMFA